MGYPVAHMRVVIADDAVLFREGLARVLAEAGFEVVGQAGTVDELLAVVREARPDLAILDVGMPPVEIRREHPGLAVLLLSRHVETRPLIALMRDGARGIGYLLKENVVDVERFCDHVRVVGAGGSVIDPDVISELVSRQQTRDRLQELTDGERQVLRLMAEGRSNSAIGQRLSIAPKTVEARVTSIFSKLGLEPVPDGHRRVLAVLTYLRWEEGAGG
jgi:DNA-binding NarL/FixJ family response regulator